MQYTVRMRFADDLVAIEVPDRLTFTVKNSIGLLVRARPPKIVASVGESEDDFKVQHGLATLPQDMEFCRAIDPATFDADLAGAFILFELFSIRERLGRLKFPRLADRVDLFVESPGLDVERASRLRKPLAILRRTNIVVNGQSVRRRWF